MLSVEDLVKVYPGGVTALQGISIKIGSGMFGLLGPNGAGKSTLMKIISGLLEPTSGKVLLNGTNIVEKPEAVWAGLGYLPQDFGFYPHLSGEAMLIYLLELKGIQSPSGLKRLAAELLDRVNLTFAAKRKVKEYSGGMRQRLGIAQALAGNPELIIVDEPTSGLDPEERVRFYHLLSELGQDRTIILSTHIVEDVKVLCPRFAVIQRGRLIAETTPSEAIEKLKSTLFEGTVERAQMESFAQKYFVTQAVLFEGRSRARIYLPSGSPPENFAAATPTLEDAYFIITRQAQSGEKAA
jgi:ABC-type multidrug transport system ATPase subunit